MLDFTPLWQSWEKFWQGLFANPQKLMEMQAQYWQELLKVWDAPMAAETTDKRFRAPAWQEDRFYQVLKEMYLFNARYLKNLVQEVPLDKKTTRKVSFMLDQWMNAFAPTNFIWTNPDVLKHTLESQGENLAQGFQNFIQDLQRSQNHFAIRMTDENAFAVGKSLALTPGKIVYENELMQLIQYSPTTEKIHQIPILLIPPWINKYYILDLQPHNSLVKWLVDQGFSVFMISWINPDSRHAQKDFGDYLTRGALAATQEILRITGQPHLNALGFCIGGTLLASTLAYLSVKKKPLIQSATFLGTLLDFSDPGDIEVFIDEQQINALEKMMSKSGYLDGGYMSATFNLLRSNDLIWSYFVNNYLQGKQPAPFDILYWNADATNMPAKMHSQYLRDMYLHNRLREPGGMTLAGVPIDLSKVKVPVYCLATQQDHIAPWQSVFASMQCLSSAVRFVLGESGHIAGIVNPPSAKKYGYRSNEQAPLSNPAAWLETATFHQASWWEDWGKWLAEKSGPLVKATAPTNAIEEAPGSYVKVRLNKAITN